MGSVGASVVQLSIGSWYERQLVDSGRAAALWALIGFVVTFVTVRTITRRIRSRTESAAAAKAGDDTAADATAAAEPPPTGAW